MSLMGTLAKVAIGYAAARGMDKMAGGKGLGGLMGGAQVPGQEAQAGQMPGMGGLQDMLGQLTGGGAAGGAMGNLQDMMAGLTKGGGLDLGSLMGGGSSGGDAQGGLLSGAGGAAGGAGLAGILAMLGGAAKMSGQSAAQMADAMQPAQTAPEMEDAAALLLSAMIQAAKSDGGIDAEEQEKILETVGGDADSDEMAFIQAELAKPIDIAGLAARTPEMQKPQLYAMSLMTIRLDSQAEAQYLDQLASALGLNQQTVNAIHMQMGVQPLYS